MALETPTYISDFTVTTRRQRTTYPKATTISQHEDRIKATFPNVSGAVTATHTELNIIDGVTASTAELNILKGVTATTAELNYMAGVTSAVQTQLGTKAPLTPRRCRLRRTTSTPPQTTTTSCGPTLPRRHLPLRRRKMTP